MTVKTVLSAKGGDVISIEPTATLETAVKTLAKHRIGALLVLGPDRRVIGILSERDIVRALGEQGADVLAQPLAHGADDDGQVPPRSGRRAGSGGRHHLDRRRRQAPPARNGARVRGIARLYPNSVKDDRAGPARRRACIEQVRAQLHVSERRACAALGQHRSTQRKVPRGRDDEQRLTADIIELARQYGRYGFARSPSSCARRAGSSTTSGSSVSGNVRG